MRLNEKRVPEIEIISCHRKHGGYQYIRSCTRLSDLVPVREENGPMRPNEG